MAADPLANTQYLQHQPEQSPPSPPPQPERQQQQEPPIPGPSRTQSFGLPSIPRTTSFGWRGAGAHGAEAAQSPVAHDSDSGPPARAGDAPSAMASRDANAQSMLEQQPSDIPPQYIQPATASSQHPPPHERFDPHDPESLPPHQDSNGIVGGIAPGQNGGMQPTFPSRSSPALAQSSQIPGQAGSPSLQGQSFLTTAGGLRPGPSPPLGGNPVQHFPPSPHWKLEVANLSEPLNTSRKSPPTAQLGFYATDKETGMEVSATAAPSPPLQRTPRNSGLPPVAARRYPELFSAGGSHQPQVQPHAVSQQDRIQVVQIPRYGNPDMPRTTNNAQSSGDGHARRTSDLHSDFDEKPSYGHHDSIDPAPLSLRDEVSESSIPPPPQIKEQPRRSSFLASNNAVPANDLSSAPPSQEPQQDAGHQPQDTGPPEKKKSFFGGAGLPVLSKKTEGASSKSDANPKEHGLGGGAKKRLSDLKGIFKNSPNDDEQPAKPSPPLTGRSSLQGPSQGPPSRHQWQRETSHAEPGTHPEPPAPQANALHGPSSPPLRAKDSQWPLSSGAPNASHPQITAEDRPRKPSAFLGGIFGNRPGSKPHDHLSTNASHVGHPPTQPGHPSQPEHMVVPGQPSTAFGRGQPGQRPMAMGNPQASQGFPNQRHPSMPGPNGAMMGVRRASQQPNGPLEPQHQQLQYPGVGHRPRVLSQGSQGSQKPHNPQLQPLGSNPIDPVAPSKDQVLAAPRQDSPSLSGKTSHERLSVGVPTNVPRASPVRKPVGSGPEQRDRGASFTLSQLPGPMPAQKLGPGNSTGGSKSEVQIATRPIEPHPALTGQRLTSQPSLTQLGATETSGHSRQHSLTAPSAVSMAQRSSSSESPDVPGHPSRPIQPSDPGAPGQFVVGTAGGSYHGHQQQQSWGVHGPPRPTATPGAPGQQQMHPPTPANQGQQLTAPSQEQQKTSSMSKLFGGNKRTSTQHQQANPQGQPKEASRRFTGLFKRNSKQPEAEPEQHKPSQDQRSPSYPPAAGRGMAGQPMPQERHGPPLGPNSQASFPGSGPLPNMMPGHDQVPPHAMRHMVAVRGQMPPQMAQQMQQMQQMQHMQQMQQTQAGRGEQQPQQMFLQPSIPGQQQQQYAPVPIPRGYDAVHGYGGSSQMAPSPYNIGRGVPVGSMYYGQQPHGYAPMAQQQQQQQQQQPPPPLQHHAQFPAGQAPPLSKSPAAQSHQSQPGSQSHSPAPQQQTMTPPPSTGSPAPQQHMMHLPQPAGSPAPPQQQVVNPPQPTGSPAPQAQSPPSSQVLAGENPSRFVSPDSTHDPRSQVNSVSPPQDDGAMPRSHPQHIITTMDMQHPAPHIQHPGSPQNYPLPSSASTFSPVNPAAGRLPNPAAPPVDSTAAFPSGPDNARGSSDLGHTPPSTGLDASPHGSFSVAQEPSHQSSLSPQPSANALQQHANPNLNVNVERANSHSPLREDIYDATPRKAYAPREYSQASPAVTHEQSSQHGINGMAVVGGVAAGAAAGAAAQDMVTQAGSFFVEGSNGEMAGAVPQGSPSAGVEGSKPAPTDVSSTRSGTPLPPNAQFAAPAEPEEKILVDQPVELAAAPDDMDDGIPVMSATSYPGQEWNPYGYGEFGDFEA